MTSLTIFLWCLAVSLAFWITIARVFVMVIT